MGGITMAGDINIEIERVAFGGAPPLIENLRASIKGGKIAAFVGPSGAGKTTLLRIIAGLEQDYSGGIWLDTEPVSGPGRDRQVVFQDTRLFPWMTALDNVAFASSAKARAERRKQAAEWLTRVGLAGRMHALPRTLSGGEKSRVALARALIEPPSVLLLDEPFTGLDIHARVRLIALIHEFQEQIGFTAILVSHETYDVAMLADEVFVIGADPMRIERHLVIAEPRPRALGATAVLEAMRDISAALTASTG
jgi:ABC-type nitrate/sulfonate/bicarbonate transport system ATPase subunit